LKIKAITIKGFKSFRDKQTFDFSKLTDNGFYYIAGDNLVETHLGANAAGKSAFVEAICWCLFGKTSTNLIASNIANWDSKQCIVSLLVEVKDIEHTILRTWNPNSITLDDKTVIQDEIDAITGLNFKSFLYSVFISQFSSKFFDLDPADKMDVFSDIMNDVVQEWDDYSAYASYKRTSLESIIAQQELGLSRLDGKISANTWNYQTNVDDFEEKRKRKLIDTERAIELHKAKRDKLEHKREIFAQEQVSIQGNVDDAERVLTSLEVKLRENRSIHAETSEQVGGLRQSFNFIKGRIEDLGDLGKTCPLCEQEVTDETLLKVLEGYHVQQKDVIKNLDLAKNKFGSCIDKVNSLESEVKARLSDLNNLKNALFASKSSLKTIPLDLQDIEEDILRCKTEIEGIKTEANPFLGIEEQKKKSLAILNRYRQYLKEDVDNGKSNLNMYSLWSKSFREIRFLVIEDALKEFEINIMNNLEYFGMSDWTIELKVDNPTKKGTVKKGFTVYVKSPNNTELVPFSCWSGGEGQRLKMAGTFGLIDFIQSKRGTNWDIEIYDEPTQFLSGEGIDDMVNILYQRSKNLNKKIMIIDHRNFSTFGCFSGTIKIVKDDGGSKFSDMQ
jgi:DNA repair exonuclease SbcCD ATPase subunit